MRRDVVTTVVLLQSVGGPMSPTHLMHRLTSKRVLFGDGVLGTAPEAIASAATGGAAAVMNGDHFNDGAAVIAGTAQRTSSTLRPTVAVLGAAAAPSMGIISVASPKGAPAMKRPLFSHPEEVTTLTDGL